MAKSGEQARVAGSYEEADRVARVTLVLNALLCATKIVAGWVGGSFALIADGLNNLTDLGISVALVMGIRFARRPADHEHAYGHGKLEQEVSRLVAIGVLVTGGGIIIGSLFTLDDPHNLPAPIVVWVALFSVFLKLWMYRYQARAAARLKSSALEADALNHKSDVAATLCVLGGTAAIWIGGTAYAWADDAAAAVIGVLMILAAGHSILTTSRELLDQMPPDDILGQLRELTSSFPGVTGVEKILGRKSGMHYLIDLHLEVPGEMTVDEAHTLSHQVKDWVLAAMPEILDIIVHVEPDEAVGEP